MLFYIAGLSSHSIRLCHVANHFTTACRPRLNPTVFYTMYLQPRQCFLRHCALDVHLNVVSNDACQDIPEVRDRWFHNSNAGSPVWTKSQTNHFLFEPSRTVVAKYDKSVSLLPFCCLSSVQTTCSQSFLHSWSLSISFHNVLRQVIKEYERLYLKHRSLSPSFPDVATSINFNRPCKLSLLWRDFFFVN